MEKVEAKRIQCPEQIPRKALVLRVNEHVPVGSNFYILLPPALGSEDQFFQFVNVINFVERQQDGRRV